MRLSVCAGTIRSVLTSGWSHGTTTPECALNGFTPLDPPLPDVHEVSLDRRRRRHRRADQVRPSPGALPPLEVAVGSRRAALPGAQDIRIHPEAHRAPRLPPLEAGALEHAVQPLALRGPPDLLGAGDDHGPDLRVHPAAGHDAGRRPEVFEPGVR